MKLKNIEPTLKYYELMMVKKLKKIRVFELPDGFKYVFWNDDSCKQAWIKIHTETGEFNSIEKEAKPIFDNCYSKFYNELPLRCIFIEDNMGEKVATATISPAHKFGYKCVIDWFAISPKAQGLKLSKSLLAKTLQTAKQLGYKKILLHTQTTTWLAAKIYLDFGFKPFKTKQKYGWRILKTITNHSKLKNFKPLQENEIYDDFMLKIQTKLNAYHQNYTFSVWYIDNRNDIFVKEGEQFFEYKYQLNNENIELIKQN
ncbi:MAG: GNAT family N-acetyltransferase [Clostridia bacterium]|nr:GNAT family N-acetyltransferase [Clostridia bacterium]